MVWDLRRYTRNQAMFASTLFRGIIYHPDESQMLTCGSDRKLSYWDAYDGTAIRVIEGSNQEINTIDITKPEIVGIDPIITKEVLDANPNWQPEWGG